MKKKFITAKVRCSFLWEYVMVRYEWLQVLIARNFSLPLHQDYEKLHFTNLWPDGACTAIQSAHHSTRSLAKAPCMDCFESCTKRKTRRHWLFPATASIHARASCAYYSGTWGAVVIRLPRRNRLGVTLCLNLARSFGGHNRHDSHRSTRMVRN